MIVFDREAQFAADRQVYDRFLRLAKHFCRGLDPDELEDESVRKGRLEAFFSLLSDDVMKSLARLMNGDYISRLKLMDHMPMFDADYVVSQIPKVENWAIGSKEARAHEDRESFQVVVSERDCRQWWFSKGAMVHESYVCRDMSDRAREVKEICSCRVFVGTLYIDELEEVL